MIAPLALALAASTVLEPTGKWEMNYDTNHCSLTRSYGDKVLRISWLPLSDNYQLGEVDGAVKGTRPERKAVRYRIDPGPATDGFADQVYWRDHGRFTQIGVKGDPIAMLEMATVVRPVDTADRAAYAVVGGTAAARAMRACRDDWMRTAGLDPVAYTTITTPAVPIEPEKWIGPDDYPAAALRADQQGDSIILWTIDDKGRVESCRVLASAGAALLDETACRLIVKRGHYLPARNASGQPVASAATRIVRWLMPN